MITAIFVRNSITHRCPNFKGSSTKQQLKLVYRCIIKSIWFTLTWSFINALIPMLVHIISVGKCGPSRRFNIVHFIIFYFPILSSTYSYMFHEWAVFVISVTYSFRKRMYRHQSIAVGMSWFPIIEVLFSLIIIYHTQSNFHRQI